MSMNTCSAVINTIGISLVAFGSICVAYEVVQRFQGERYATTTQPVVNDQMNMPLGSPPFAQFVGLSTTRAEDTVAYKRWERRRNVVMSIGLGLILLGSGFQVWASWI
jgi:hypothetical protein